MTTLIHREAPIEESGVSVGGRASGRFRALFFLPGIVYFRVFENLLRAMLAAGHQVVVALDSQSGTQDQASVLDELRRHPRFKYEQQPPRKGLWLVPASAIRRRLDYLRYLDPGHPDPDAAPQPSWGLRALLFLPPFRWPFGRRLLVRVLRRLEAGMPICRNTRSFISDQAPDLVVVSPLVEFGSPQADDLRAAQVAGIPTVFLVASEDDLISKGGIRDVPTATIARDDAGADAAVSLHGLPRATIAATGDQSSNGDAPATPGAVEAIERAASTEVAPRREGRVPAAGALAADAPAGALAPARSTARDRSGRPQGHPQTGEVVASTCQGSTKGESSRSQGKEDRRGRRSERT